MTIRPVDLQTMIPKIPEVQKERNIESELGKNNLNINIHKEQLKQEKITKQVVETEKNHGARIDREKQQKEKHSKQGKRNKDNQAEEEEAPARNTKGKTLTQIDIRI